MRRGANTAGQHGLRGKGGSIVLVSLQVAQLINSFREVLTIRSYFNLYCLADTHLSVHGSNSNLLTVFNKCFSVPQICVSSVRVHSTAAS